MKSDEMMFSEVVDSPESAAEFMKMNGIKNALIVVVWVEKIGKPFVKKRGKR